MVYNYIVYHDSCIALLAHCNKVERFANYRNELRIAIYKPYAQNLYTSAGYFVKKKIPISIILPPPR